MISNLRVQNKWTKEENANCRDEILKKSDENKTRNRDIRKNLKTESVLKLMEQNKIIWFGHISRIKENSQIKRIWQARVVQIRRRWWTRKEEG